MYKKLLLVVAILATAVMVNAQTIVVSGGTTATSGSPYFTIKDAVDAINVGGALTGNVTVDVPAGHIENLTAPIVLTATGTSTESLVFQKSGAGANPLITAFVGTNLASAATIDVMWQVNGSDYVTIDGIDFVDTNSTGAPMMEVAVGFFKVSATDGCNNNTVKNCVITLNRNNTVAGSGIRTQVAGSVGIALLACTPSAANTAILQTSLAGASSNNSFQNNTIQNVNMGIAMVGGAVASPYALADLNNVIGGSSTTGNNIINFGGGTSPSFACAAALIRDQWSFTISHNVIDNNVGGTGGFNHTTSQRGIWLFAASAGASANINNNTLTIRGAGTGINWIIDVEMAQTGANGNTININNNQFLNCTQVVTTAAAFVPIWLNTTASNINVTGNTIDNFSTPTTGLTYLVLNQLANTSNLNISNNNFTNIAFTNSGTKGIIYLTSSTGNLTVNNNVINNVVGTNTTTTTSIFCIYHLGTTGTFNCLGNTISNVTIAGTGGTFYGVYTGSPVNGFFNNNLVENVSYTLPTSTGTSFGIYDISSGQNMTYNNNIIRNFSTPTTGQLTGIREFGISNIAYTKRITNNQVYNFSTTPGGVGGGLFSGVSKQTFGGNDTMSGNVIYALNSTGTTGGTGNSVIGLASSNSTNTRVFNNKICDLSTNSTGGSVFGMQFTAGSNYDIYNNYIGDLRGQAFNVANNLMGINISSATAGTTYNVYNNTVRLNATSSGATFGSTAFFANSVPTVLAQNNIFINLSTPNGATGFTAAYRRSSTTLTSYSGASNNNLLHAGVPSANNLIYYDGTNADQTLAAYKTRVFPRETGAVTEDVSFLSTNCSSPGFLHIDPSVATQVESGAIPISTVGVDYDGDIRQGFPGYAGTSTAAPDLGADEGDFILSDITAPSFTNVALSGNACGLTSRNVTATLTDASGIPTTGTLMPRIYYNKNGGAFVSDPGVLNTGNANNGNWTFTMTFANVGGITTGDVIGYYLIAQDIAGTPNLGSTPSGVVATDVNTVTTAPTASTYTVVSTLSSNTYAVGVGGDFATLTDAVTAYNNSCLDGPVIFSLTDLLYNESVTILNNADASAVNSLFIQPVNPGTVISGNAATGTIRMSGARFVIVDGSPDGLGGYVSGDNMVVRNTLGTAPAIQLINDANNCTVRWADLQSNNSGANATANAGVVNIGTTTGNNGNDNNTIADCDIHNITGGNPVVGISALGNTISVNANNDNNTINNCNIYDIFSATLAFTGVYVGTGNSSWTITNNNVYQTVPRTQTTTFLINRGFWITPNTASLTSASGFTINNNFIGGNAGDGTGTMDLTGTSISYYGMDLSVGVGAATSVQGNTFSNTTITGPTGNPGYLGIGIANGNVNCGTVSGNLVGSNTVNGAITMNAGNFGGLTGFRVTAGTQTTFANNQVSGITLNGTNTLNIPSFIGISATGGTLTTVTNNTVGSATLANSIFVPTTSTTTTSAPTFRGIQVGGTNITVTNNLVANITHNNEGTSTASIQGIAATSGIVNISGNTVRDIKHASRGTAGGTTCAISGIMFSNFTAPSTIANNTIHSLSLSNTTNTNATQIVGLYYSNSAGTTANNIIERNNIHSIGMASTANAAGYISGMDVANGTLTVRNNMIRLGIDQNGNDIVAPCFVRGISKNVAVSNIYHNTVFIGGQGVGGSTATGSYAMWRTGSAVDDIRNNIFVNKRSNATVGSSHYAIQMLNTTTLTINNNLYFVSGAGGVLANVGAFGPTLPANDKATLVDLQTATAQDANSVNVDANFINAIGGASTVNLHILNTIATPVESGGASGTGVGVDIDNDIRQGNVGYVGAGTAPDLGADEFELNLVPCSGTPTAGSISPAVAQKCGSGNQTFSAIGATADIGMTYQWEESNSLSGPWANVTTGSGATTLYYTTAVLTGPTTMYYRMVAKCTVSGDSSFSAPATLNVGAPTVFSIVTSPSNNIYCSGGPGVSLTASGTPVSYAWTPSASLNTATGATVLASPLSGTTYVATGTDANGCTSTQSVLITVSATPLFSVVSATPPTICDGTSSNLSASAVVPSGPLSSYALTSTTGGTYTPLTGAGITTINTTAQLLSTMGSVNQDDGGVVVNLPFTFNYMGSSYTNMTFCTNGWIGAGNQGTIDAVSMRVAGNLFIPTIPNNTLAAWFKDMGANFPAGTGSMRHGEISTGVYAFQWDNAVGSGFSDGSTNLISFQINIHGSASATPGRIEYLYGPTAGTTAFAASLGIENAVGGPNQFINALNGSDVSTTTSTVWPGNGNGYRFDPIPATSLSWSWAPSGQVVSPNTATTATTNLNATTVYTVTASTGICANSTTVTVTVSPLSCSAITLGAINCANTNFTASISPIGGGAPYSYAWSDGAGGVYPNAATVTVNKPAGTYTLTCTITDNCAASCTSSIPVTINAQPNVTLVASSPVYCVPGPGVVLTAGGASTYAYSPNGSLTPTTGSIVTATPSAATTYVVTGTDANGCTNTASVSVNNSAAVNMGSVTASPSSVLCGASSTLEANAAVVVSSYCSPAYTSATTSGDWCSLVQISGTTLNNPSVGAAALPNYTFYPATGSTTATLVAGTTYTMTVGFGTFSSNDIAAFIDYNQNGVLDTTVAEKIGQGYNLPAAPTTYSMVFTVPLTAINGLTRLRVREADQGTTSMDPCVTYTFGEVEDYTITIVGGVNPVGSVDFTWSQSPVNSTLSSTTGSPVTASNITGTTTYTVVASTAAGCSATGTTTVTVTGSCNTTLDLTAIIQGYWLGTEMSEVLSLQGEPTTLGACDSIDVSLVDSATLNVLVTKRAVLNKNGLANVVFPGSFTGSYYIKLAHRNAMETWSKYTVSMAGTPSYNFTTSADQAYGDNQVEVSPGVFALYSGDIVKDANEAIELTDIAQLESDNSNFAFGYQASDINGDGGVDLGDFPLVEANVNGFIFANHP